MSIDKGLLNHLSTFVSDHKKTLIEQILSKRTRALTIVVENIYQSQNASAVLRTADCFGIQDVHIIENDNAYEINPDVALGSNKWITIHNYNQTKNNTLVCLNELKSKGYRLLASSPRGRIPVEEIDLQENTAILFGNELHGLSEVAMENADDSFYIPMYGFTESFNISVSAAICMSILRSKLEQHNKAIYLSEKEKNELRLQFYKSIVRGSEKIEKRYLNSLNSDEA